MYSRASKLLTVSTKNIQRCIVCKYSFSHLKQNTLFKSCFTIGSMKNVMFYSENVKTKLQRNGNYYEI